MKSVLALMTLAVSPLAACDTSGQHVAPVPQARAAFQEALPASFPEFVDEACGTWATFNRGDAQRFLEFYERIPALAAVPRFSEYAFQILGDPLRVRCWSIPAYIIGFAGSETDVARLLEHIEALRPGRWELKSSSEATGVTHSSASIRRGLALATNRLGEQHPLTVQILDHLAAATQKSYWRIEGRLPRLHAGIYPNQDLEEVRQGFIGAAVEQVVTAMGDSGYATERLLQLEEEALSNPEWAEHVNRRGELTRFRLAVNRSRAIQSLGLDRHFRTNPTDY